MQPMGEPTSMPSQLLAGCPVGTRVQMAIVVRLFRDPQGREGVHVQYDQEQPESSIRQLGRAIEAIFQAEQVKATQAANAIALPTPDQASALLKGRTP